VKQPMYMGHEYCGVVEEVGSDVKTVKPGQFVVGSFCLSDNTCPHCTFGYQSACEQREFMTGAQAPTRQADNRYLASRFFCAT
jgi:threonine dehydrogenase-like Zn-dependent dehydrogenase